MEPLKYFLVEAREHLEGLNAGLLQLEQDTHDAATLESLFRQAHTLKGSARMVSMDALGDVAHRLEDALCAIRDHNTPATAHGVSAMLGAVDVITQMVDALDAGSTRPVDTASALAGLASFLDPCPPLVGMENPVGDPVIGGPAGNMPEMPGAAPDAGNGLLQFHVPGPATPNPEPAAVRAGSASDTPATAPPVASGVKAAPVSDPAPVASAHIRVALDKVDQLANLTGELLIQKLRVAEQSRRMQSLSHDVIRTIQDLSELQNWARDPAVAAWLAGTTEGKHLLGLLNRSQPVAVREQMKTVAVEARDQAARLDQVISTLHDGVMDLRMISAASLTTPLRLVVRETAAAVGRQVQLQMVGEDLEVDKALLEGLREPLGHLVRNAITHGIEPTEVRRRADKPATGTVRVAFERAGARLTVTVSDDGAGFDLERIRAAAVQGGLADAAAVARAGPRELLAYLVRAGFSTAAEVTADAGRGVGLDAVATRVRELKGHMDFRVGPAGGAIVVMRLPLNLASMDGFLFSCGHRTFTVPLGSVVRVARMSRDRVGRCGGQSVVRLGDEALPTLSLHQMGVAPGAVVEADRSGEWVILTSAGASFAVEVDRAIGVRTLLVKPLPPHVGELPWVSGLTVLADGRPAVILDVDHLYAEIGGAPTAQAEATDGDMDGPPAEFGAGASNRSTDAPTTSVTSKGAGADAAGPTVLVVDDSLSVRMSLQQTLRRAGYRVILAEDGEAALVRLQSAAIDLIVTDVEMPRLNGWDLLERVRREAVTRNLPVVVMSSLAPESARRQSLERGADAWVAKGELDLERLVRTVGELIEHGR